MEPNQERSIIPRHDAVVIRTTGSPNRILAEMVSESVKTARRELNVSTRAVEQAVKWLDQNKGCGWECRKCNLNFQRTFDALEESQRQPLVDAICTTDIGAFEKHEPLLWLVALLNNTEFERLIARFISQAPFDRDLAWRLIRLSAGNQGAWRFDLTRGRASLFKPRFHLHPALAPLLLEASIRAATETEDTLELLTYFKPIAGQHPIFRNHDGSLSGNDT